MDDRVKDEDELDAEQRARRARPGRVVLVGSLLCLLLQLWVVEVLFVALVSFIYLDGVPFDIGYWFRVGWGIMTITATVGMLLAIVAAGQGRGASSLVVFLLNLMAFGFLAWLYLM